jgi:hypothetical protein
VTLSPWGVRDFRNDGIDATIGSVIAKIEADGVEDIPEVAEMGKKTDGSSRSIARSCFHELANRFIQRNASIANMVRALEGSKVGAVNGPEPSILK